MPGIDLIGSYVLFTAMATLLVAVVVYQTQQKGRAVTVWLQSSVLGVLLGVFGAYAAVRTLHYQVVREPKPAKDSGNSAPAGMAGMGGMGGMRMGMGGPGMGGGQARPRSKRDLTTLVRKLDLLTGDIAITLSADQAAAVRQCLGDLDKPAKMSEDDAKPKYEKLLAVLNDAQKARLDAIGLPPPARRSGGRGGMPGMGAPRGGPGGMPGMGAPKGGPGGMPGMGGMMGGMPGMGGGMPGMGGPRQNNDQNPFQQGAEAKALKNLRERLAPKTNAEKPQAKPADKPPASGTGKPAAPAAAKPPEKPAAKAAEKAPAKKP